MRKLLLFALLLAAVAVACTKVPVTGRRQLNLIPDSLMLPIGRSAYQSAVAGLHLERKGSRHDQVTGVADGITKVAGSDRFDWHTTVIDDPETVNAWAVPSGHVAVYTGILPVCSNEAGLAFILGHEVGHVLARHGAERLSQQLAVLGGLAGLYAWTEKRSELSEQQQAVLLSAVGLGAEVGLVLPFSRKHEREADIIGMMLMARAGYPPSEAISIWDRMEAAGSGSHIPAFLSTHPSDEQRKENLRAWLPQARRRYERNALPRDTTAQLWR
ncbi:MAG: M48 family metallopeptidase [Pseudomonadota bacterium]